jgi:transposase
MARPFAVPITLSDAERATLLSWTRRQKTAQALARRARIVLAAAEPGTTNTAITARFGVSTMTVTKWRNRFAAHGLAGLHDAPRPGAKRTITDAHVEQIITTTLEQAPTDATHWSTRRLAAQLGLSQSAISRIWRAFGLAPHKSEAFKLSRDPLFIDKVRDVVGLYLNPPERALVLCVDEKPQIQATEGTMPVLPMRPGQPEQHSHDYIRHGTRDLFAALDVQAGTVIGELRHRHRSVEFRKFLDTVDASTPPDLELHLILDNSSIHKTPLIHRWLLRHPRVHLHFHADERVMAQSRRVLVRAADDPPARPWHVPQHLGAGAGDQELHRRDERRGQAVHVDQNRR